MEALGKAKVTLRVDQATAQVFVYIVPNEAQAVYLLVGRPFTRQRHATGVRGGDSLRRLQEEMSPSSQSDPLGDLQIPNSPVLWAKEAIVIPPKLRGVREGLLELSKQRKYVH